MKTSFLLSERIHSKTNGFILDLVSGTAHQQEERHQKQQGTNPSAE
jgi:hypothetical protein